MRVIDWVWCDDRSKAKLACNKLLAMGARVINVSDGPHGTTVWFEFEGEVDKDAMDRLVKGGEA